MIKVCFLFVLLLAACGPTPNTVAPPEQWPAIGTRQAAESTAVALTPTVSAVGHLDVRIAARNAGHAMEQMRDVLAASANYETVRIVVESGGAVVLTAVYEHGRTGGITWDGDWTPTVFVMRGAATEWVANSDFWNGN
jgi:hypothetical protein